MKRRILQTLCAALTILKLSTGSAAATQVLYTNYLPEGSTPAVGLAISGGSDRTGYHSIAVPFMLHAPATVETFRVIFFDSSGGLIDAVLSFSSNGAPGGMIETMPSIELLPRNGDVVYDLHSAYPPTLDPGQYWLTIQPHAPDSSVHAAWTFANLGGPVNIASTSVLPPQWRLSQNTPGCFQVLGTVVPEPSTLLLSGFAMAFLMVMRRRSVSSKVS